MTDRALSPVVGTLLLVVLVLSTAAVVATASEAVVSDASVRAASAVPGAPGVSSASDGSSVPGAGFSGASGARPSPSAPTAFSLSATGDRLAVTYERGPTLDVPALRLRIAVDGEPLAFQPPVPFFAARGFRSGPTGPFNVAADGAWAAGETGTLAVAATNDPRLESGRTVTVRIYRNSSSRPLATLTASVDGDSR